jgi:hypothetical protein
MFLKHRRHVICHIIATSSTTSSLQVMWQVNPWRSLSSQILGFGLGSLGFTPIYDSLKMSWIMTIHEETVNTSREVICDAQSMTKWNFVIYVVLWRKLDDLWRKSTIVDHTVFCSEAIGWTAFAWWRSGCSWNDGRGSWSAEEVDPLIQVIITSSIRSNRRFLDQSRSSKLCTRGRKCLGPRTWHGVGAATPGRVDRAWFVCHVGSISP